MKMNLKWNLKEILAEKNCSNVQLSVSYVVDFFKTGLQVLNANVGKILLVK